MKRGKNLNMKTGPKPNKKKINFILRKRVQGLSYNDIVAVFYLKFGYFVSYGYIAKVCKEVNYVNK